MGKYGKCKKCGTYSVHLASAYGIVFLGDQDDENGDRSEYEDVEASQDNDVSLFAHICFNCGYLVDVGIESPRDKVINTSTMKSEQ